MLDLECLKKHREDIFKAEIGALLFNIGKTHVGFEAWKGYFDRKIDKKFVKYDEYFNEMDKKKNTPYYKIELAGNPDLINYFFHAKLSLPANGSDDKIQKLDLLEIMKGRGSGEIIVEKVFFRGCENINSGIDKGSPGDKIKGKLLFIANAFGTSKKKLCCSDFDERRMSFWKELDGFLKSNEYYGNYGNDTGWKAIKNWISNEIRKWYSGLLSDSRFPVNDVTLWDQVYMTATMFKAALADMFLIMNDTYKETDYKAYFENPNSIKWRIMGIQYDKLGLAERGFKPAQIKWYRENTRQIDNRVKGIIENEYCLGNEIYRDETGIYFLVGQNLGKGNDGDLTYLHPDLVKVKTEILKAFETYDEFYPAILLTKASRGLMNLSYLLEQAKNNFLQADYSRYHCIDDKTGNGLCPVCQKRVFSVSNGEERIDEDKRICDFCYEEKTRGRLEEWEKDPENNETIWTSELQDKNGRIALVTLKFELGEWLNGNMVNQLVNRKTPMEDYQQLVETTIKLLRNAGKNRKEFHLQKTELDEFLNYFDQKGVKTPFNSTIKPLLKEQNYLTNITADEKFRALFFRAVEPFLTEQCNISFSDFASSELETEYIEKEKRLKNIRCPKDHDLLVSIFSVGFFYLQIKNLLLERSIGSSWEVFIKENLSSQELIDFETRQIKLNELQDGDIKLVAILISQFLIRKNPSPARLRRIWETTEGFFEGINLIDNKVIPDKERCRRLVWKNQDDIPDGEYQDGESLFWAKGGTVYLITPQNKIPDGKKGFKLKPYEKTDSEASFHLSRNNAIQQKYKPYFSIIDPTPISWQFVIPVEYIPNLIENISFLYNKNFTWVYGKLPLHIGIVIQDYKKPLYLGVKALRKIRRDNVNYIDLRRKIEGKKLQNTLKRIKVEEEEKRNHSCDYYSLYESASDKGIYQFYIRPGGNEPQWLWPLSMMDETEQIYYYPNTFDFEFLDTNTRRNEIFYKKGQRQLPYKRNRPYTLEEANKIMQFGQIFVPNPQKNPVSVSLLHNFITQLYSKYESWNIEKGENIDSMKTFFVSLLINTFSLNSHANTDLKQKILEMLDVQDFNDLKKIDDADFIWRVKLFFDGFEFWHKALKEV